MEDSVNHIVRLVIFDFDGTLGDTRDKIVDVMQHVMAEEGQVEIEKMLNLKR